MAAVVDTGALIALVDADDAIHEAVRSLFDETREPLIVSPFVIAEADHLVERRLGTAVELALMADVAGGAFAIAPLERGDVAACVRIAARHRDMNIGLTDASILYLAERHDTRRIVTNDERHFRALRTARGEPFVILPADEPSGRKKR